MRKFFFDDVRAKPGDEWVLARDVPQAREILSVQDFDVMSLDHDIGMQMMCKQCYDEIPKPFQSGVADHKLIVEKLKLGCVHMEHGTDLAKWMVEHLTVWPRLIVIHSANRYAAERMASILNPYSVVRIIRYDQCQWDSLKEI